MSQSKVSTQHKLTKAEWIWMEQAVPDKEKIILNMIKSSFHGTQIIYLQQTISTLVKLDHDEKDFYIYTVLLKESVDQLSKKYNIPHIELTKPKKKLNTADTIRLTSQQKKVSDNIEMTLIELVHKLLKELSKPKKELYFYNICHLFKIYKLNSYIHQFVKSIIDKYSETMDIIHFLENTERFIETNTIFDYNPLQLYDHQKTLLTLFQDLSRPKFVFYRAPTSSGKTLTPIGLCDSCKGIFLCPSRQVALSLAKSAVNVGRKVAFAFGCTTPEDVRLHYFSVNTYSNDKFKRPNHSDGQKVELMFCDIKSYEIAMLYMTSFFDKNNMFMFYDEPTIKMNEEYDELHDDVKRIWEINVIPNIILSSATLPNQDEMQPIIDRYISKYSGEIHYIDTYDETTNVSLLDTNGAVIMPHNVFKNITDVEKFIEMHGKTHMKFLSVSECAIFILYVCKNVFSMDIIIEHFRMIQNISTKSIRELYYIVLQKIKKTDYTFILQNYESFKRTKKVDIGIELTTRHSFTLTYGPTMFICEDINKWVSYFVDNSGIHTSSFTELEKSISYNNDLIEKIIKKKQQMEDNTSKDEKNENKMKEQRFDPNTKLLIQEIDKLELMLKPIQLNSLYIPNTREHFSKWCNKRFEDSNVFTSRVEEKYVRKIMNLQVHTNYKILLLMGIGIFNPNEILEEYNDVMKELAEDKQLLFIISTSNFMYGTNYQFCHAIFAEELQNVTQEQIIQSIGRVGRKEKNKLFTFRFRDNTHIMVLFVKTNTIESDNMNKLFI
jgi:hypothetical protein